MASGVGKFFAKIVELVDRTIKPTGEDKVYSNDVDNLYPNRVEITERNSVTANAASNKMKSFISGKGFVNNEFNEMIVNPKTGLNGYGLLDKIADSLSTHRGAFLYVNYDIEGNVNQVDVLPFKKCRVAKEDSKGNSGKIYYKDWEEKEKFSFGSKSCKWFYPFSRNNDVIMKQRQSDAKENGGYEITDLITDYRGQVLFINLDYDSVYPYSWLNPALNDADSEFRLSVYRNTNLRTGFLDKTMFIFNGLDVETSDEMSDNVKKWLGAENSSNVFTFVPETPVDDPSKIVHTISLKGNYDSKRFENDEKNIANNIRKAYLSIPKILIDPEDNFFGSSASAFVEAVKYYNKETLFLRETIAYNMDKLFNGDFTIKELGAEDVVL